MDLVVLDDAVGLEKTILWVLVVRLIDGMREHCVVEVSGREVTADVNLVALERSPINLLVVQLD